jgi:hypothetical protein
VYIRISRIELRERAEFSLQNRLVPKNKTSKRKLAKLMQVRQSSSLADDGNPPYVRQDDDMRYSIKTTVMV